MIVYGIKNCSTMKKAFDWLDNHSIDYSFKDYRTPGLSEQEFKDILSLVDLDSLINKRSTAWRALTDDEKLAVMKDTTAISVLQNHPTLIKRPLVVNGKEATVGFSDKLFEDAFLK